MYLGDEWYLLSAKESILSEDPVDGLDVAVLQDFLLTPILGIGDPRVDKRIDFIGGIRGLKELEDRVHNDMAIAFSMFPTSISELLMWLMQICLCHLNLLGLNQSSEAAYSYTE